MAIASSCLEEISASPPEAEAELAVIGKVLAWPGHSGLAAGSTDQICRAGQGHLGSMPDLGDLWMLSSCEEGPHVLSFLRRSLTPQ